MRFRYLRDPLFLLCLAVYIVNRFLLKALWKDGFVHANLNDLICLPLCVPVLLFVQRRLGLRGDDAPPRPGELVVPLVVLSLTFEVVLPPQPALGTAFVADPWDVLCYAVGALAAALFWRWWYGRPEETSFAPETRTS